LSGRVPAPPRDPAGVVSWLPRIAIRRRWPDRGNRRGSADDRTGVRFELVEGAPV